MSNTPPYSGARFWDRMADKYSKKPVPDQQVYAKKLAQTDRLLNLSDHVLEIGCGTGSTAIHHASKVERIVAIDYSCLLYTSPSPRDLSTSRMPSSA